MHDRKPAFKVQYVAEHGHRMIAGLSYRQVTNNAHCNKHQKFILALHLLSADMAELVYIKPHEPFFQFVLFNSHDTVTSTTQCLYYHGMAQTD